MDFNALQHKLFALDPTDPREDLAKLKGAAQGGTAAPVAEPTVNYLEESADIAQGSLGLDKDYSVSDFAALAGVVTEGKQKTGSAGQAKGKDPMPKAKPGRTEHPLKDKLVGEASEDRIAQLEARVAHLEELLERSLTKGEENKKEKIVKGMKKNKSDFKDRYGDDAEAVMYATATKNAKKESTSIADELWAKLNEFSKSKS